jgi:hypothetical protein
MRRNEEIDRRQRHRAGNAAMRQRFSDGARDVGVRDELTECQRCDGTPHRDLKRGSVECKREVEPPKATPEVGAYLRAGLGEQRVARFASAARRRRDEFARDNRRAVAYNQQIAMERGPDAAAHRCSWGRHAKSGGLI